MLFTQIRHATCIVDFAGIRFIVDPIFYQKNTLNPIFGGVAKKNPLVDMPVSDALIKNVDAILLTHTHYDHFDPTINDFFGRSMPILCSSEYQKKLSKLGFHNLKPVENHIMFNDIEVIMVKGRHGTGVIGKLMGNSYGFILKAQNGETVYITGDTVWCTWVEKTIENHAPKYIVAFAGSAMVINNHITMDERDIGKILRKSPTAKVIAIHMGAWNHCRLSRSQLKEAVVDENLYIPKDGETLILT